MPVRLRITLIFFFLVFIILVIVCGSIYYFSYSSRLNMLKIRLMNRDITIGRLFSQSEVFDKRLIYRIDSATALALTNKVVEAYDQTDNKIYSYSDMPNDSIQLRAGLLDEVRRRGSLYFLSRDKEAVALSYASNGTRLVIVSAGFDIDGRRNLERLRTILVLSFLVGLIIALGGGYFFSKGLLLPIKRIADDVNEISAQNLARRIQTGTSRDEWNYLSQTLNQLLNRLQESFELQRRFISNASHELSTPLTSVSSQLEVSLQRERSPEEYQRIMRSVLQDVQHMNKLTQTLLEFAKASGSSGGLEIDLIRLDEVLLRLPAALQKTDRNYTVTLQFDALPEEEEKLLVFGNEDLLFTAVKNIVVNACKYSNDHRASVHFYMQDNQLFIEVADKGIGIPEHELVSIFQPFYRMEDTRNTDGFGLGLSLANQIIKLHKGFIKVNSTPGSGTVFTIQLPSAAVYR
jgi:two-component system, OmpR family, sensor histidine kinase ArlS